MKRALLLLVLGLGAVGGYASGFHSVRHHYYGHGPDGSCRFGHWGDARERHLDAVAAACVKAAQATPEQKPAVQ
jgi:hypothetical protein